MGNHRWLLPALAPLFSAFSTPLWAAAIADTAILDDSLNCVNDDQRVFGVDYRNRPGCHIDTSRGTRGVGASIRMAVTAP